MIHVKKNIRYYINERALAFTENALDDANRIYVSLLAGSVMYVHIPGVIDFGPDGNHEKFHLEGYSTKVASNAPYNIYARIDKELRTALILFSTKEYKADGSVNGDPSSQPSSVNVYIKIGFMTAPDGKSGKRTLTYDSGVLGTDKGNQMASESVFSEMFELDKISTPWLIKVKQLFYEFTVKKGITLLGDLVFKGKRILDVALSTDENYIREPSDDTLATTKFVNRVTEGRFLRKDKSDQTAHLQKFLGGILVDGDISLLHKGAQFGETFAGGLTGHGGRIDEKGYGELRGLRLWEFLEVPELRYNQVKVFVGVDWQCPGAGIIEKVTIDYDQQGNPAGTGVVKLKLEKGQYGAVDVDDIVMGIYHTGGSQDATENKDDSKGNFAFAGFATAYFRVTAVSGAHNDTFSYALRPGTTIHPQPMMHFACYGNFTKLNRQQSTYRTPTYTRRLWNQNDWEIKKQNIAAQDGDLSNLSVHGMQMQGYSTYLNSVYFTGTIQQVKPDGTPVMTANDRGKWLAGKYDYYDRVSHMGRLWLCVSEKGTTQEPSLSSSDWLLQVDKGEDGESPYLVEILSSRGDKFHNGVVVTTLSATVFEGKIDITDTIPASRFSWTRSSSDKDGDKVWNQLHEGIGRYLDLTSDDVYRKAIFECLIII